MQKFKIEFLHKLIGDLRNSQFEAINSFQLFGNPLKSTTNNILTYLRVPLYIIFKLCIRIKVCKKN